MDSFHKVAFFNGFLQNGTKQMEGELSNQPAPKTPRERRDQEKCKRTCQRQTP